MSRVRKTELSDPKEPVLFIGRVEGGGQRTRAERSGWSSPGSLGSGSLLRNKEREFLQGLLRR